MGKIILNLQLIDKHLYKTPSKMMLRKWLKVIFSKYSRNIEITIRLVSKTEIHRLNKKYRKKNHPTNILSFPFIPPKFIKLDLIGDLVICNEIIIKEAKKNNISIESYWAYIITHGALHLMGYNHTIDKEYRIMKLAEINIMNQLGYRNYFYNHIK